jgi:cardiolipin synthase A/B
MEDRLNTFYTLLPDGNAFVNDLVKEIQRAKTTIDLQFFTFEADSIGKRVAKYLFAAKQRGVKIRFIVDHYIDLFHNDYFIYRPRLNRGLQRIITGEWRETKELLKKMTKEGIEVRRSNPLGFLKLRRAFQRNHKKMVIIDHADSGKAIAYIGGCNLAEHNVSWNDFMVKMQGDMIPILLRDFNATWREEDINGKFKYQDGFVLTDSPNGKHEIMPYIMDLINSSKKRVWIESPYLRGNNVWASLIYAVRHGIDVRIIVPLHNNRKRTGGPKKKSMQELIRNGGKIYRFKKNGGMTHAKALLVDDIVMFGSSNLSEFMAERLCEITIATYNKSMIKQMENKLHEDMSMSILQEP